MHIGELNFKLLCERLSIIFHIIASVSFTEMRSIDYNCSL